MLRAPVTQFNPGVLAQKGSLYLTRPTSANYTATREDLLTAARELFTVVKKGVVKIKVNQTYPLREAAQAHIDLEGRKTTGSTVSPYGAPWLSKPFCTVKKAPSAGSRSTVRDDGNMFTPQMCHEIRDCINDVRRETRTRVLVITGAGDKFFCIGGRKEGMEDSTLYAGMLPTLEIYESIERLQKPVIASVNGYAVGGGQVLQVMCDLTIAKESAVFRQVGPMMGSFDAGYGTWYLEDLVGKKKAKEMWFLNPRLSAREALESGSSTRSCRTTKLEEETREMAASCRRARRVRARRVEGSVRGASWRRVAASSRISHDLLLRAISRHR